MKAQMRASRSEILCVKKKSLLVRRPSWRTLIMYKTLSRLYNQLRSRLKFREEFAEQSVNFDEDTGKLRHHNSIKDAGARLQNENLSIGKRLEAAHELGVLSYTGNYGTWKSGTQVRSQGE